MAGRDETTTTTAEEHGKAQTGRKKRIDLRIGGPGILVGVLAVAVVVGAAIRIRRYRSLREARKRVQLSCSNDRNGGLRSALQEDEEHPRCYTRDVVAAEMVLRRMMEHDSVEHEIQMENIGENEGDEASETDHGEWMAKEISESSAEEEDREEEEEEEDSSNEDKEEEDDDSANEDKEEEDYDDGKDEVTAREREEEDAQDEVAGYKAEENDDADDDDDEDERECVVEKCEEGPQGTEDSTMESNAEVVWPAEMKEWQLEIKEMKVSYQDVRRPKPQSYNFLYEVERRIPVKIKLRIWIWTTLMLLLLLLLSVTNQKTYVSLYY